MKYRLNDDPVLKAKVEALSLEELLGCVTCPNLVADHDPPIIHTLSIFIHPTTREKAHDLITKINHTASRTLFVTDMECGPGTALKGTTAFPSMRAAMQSHDPKLAYQMGACAAVEGRNAGFSWTFGPCVDIAGYHDSPITSIRSAGETARDVLTYAGNYWQGLQDYGMIATLKHFPGDGYSVNDQHLTTAVNPLDRGEWDHSFGLIYRHLIDQGAKAIMPGHIALPCYDTPDQTSGLYRPATLSKRILTDLLREKLGFEGIIISDAVNMSGFCGYMNYYHACAEFLESGGDCLLFAHPDDEFITEMKKMIDEGRLKMETLRYRAYRMLLFSDDYLNHSADCPASLDFDPKKASFDMVEQSVTLFRDRPGILPIELSGKKTAHLIIADQYNLDIPKEFTEKLSRICQVDEFTDPGPELCLKLAKNRDYDVIICTIGCSAWYGTNRIKLSGTIARNMMNGWTKYSTPVIFVDYAHPYIHEEYDAMIDTLIYTYGYNEYTVDKVIRLINKS